MQLDRCTTIFFLQSYERRRFFIEPANTFSKLPDEVESSSNSDQERIGMNGRTGEMSRVLIIQVSNEDVDEEREERWRKKEKGVNMGI